MSTLTDNQRKTGNLIMAIIGSAALGFQFSWPIGIAVFCLLPFVLRSIKGNK